METDKCPDYRPYLPCPSCLQKFEDNRIRHDFIDLCQRNGSAEKVQQMAQESDAWSVDGVLIALGIPSLLEPPKEAREE